MYQTLPDNNTIEMMIVNLDVNISITSFDASESQAGKGNAACYCSPCVYSSHKKQRTAAAALGDVRRVQEEAPPRVPFLGGIPEHRHGLQLLPLDRGGDRDAGGAVVADGGDLKIFFNFHLFLPRARFF